MARTNYLDKSVSSTVQFDQRHNREEEAPRGVLPLVNYKAVLSYCKCECADVVMDGLTLAASPCNGTMKERMNYPEATRLI